MTEVTSPVTEEYWRYWIDLGDDWRELSATDKAAILGLPLITHTNNNRRSPYQEEKIERRPDVLKYKPPEMDSKGWLVVCRLMQIYRSAGPVFNAEFHAKAHADFLGLHILCPAAGREFHRGYYSSYSPSPQKFTIDPLRFDSLRRLREFLEIRPEESGAKWEKLWIESEGSSERLNFFTGPHVTECARLLLARVAESNAPVSLHTLASELAKFHRGGILAKALRSLTNHVLIVLGYDEISGDLVADLWPPLRRKMLSQGMEVIPPAPCKEPGETFGHPFLVEDLLAVLLAASAEPLPIKSGGMLEIYAAKAKKLNATLIPVPAWVCDGLYEEVQRVQIVVGAAVSFGLLTKKKKSELSVSAEGARWLRLDARDRCRAILDILMARRWKKGWHNSSWNYCSYAGKFQVSAQQSDVLALEDSLANAFCRLPEDGSHVPLQEFLEFVCEHHNPLIHAVGHDGFVFIPVAGNYGGWSWKKRDGATLVPEIFAELRSFLETRLVPVGAVRLGKSGEQISVALTDIGRYFLGAKRSFELAPEPAAGRVVVQPNFEIVFLGPNLGAEAKLAPFCERVGSRTGTVFRLTKASVQTALHRGVEIERIADALRKAADLDIPQNVLAELSGWAAARQTYSQEHVEILRCASPEAALHVHALLPHSTKLLGGACLEVTRPLRGPDKTRLEKAGFYKSAR